MSSLTLSTKPAQYVYTNPNGLFVYALKILWGGGEMGRRLSQQRASYAMHEDLSLSTHVKSHQW